MDRLEVAFHAWKAGAISDAELRFALFGPDADAFDRDAPNSARAATASGEEPLCRYPASGGPCDRDAASILHRCIASCVVTHEPDDGCHPFMPGYPMTIDPASVVKEYLAVAREDGGGHVEVPPGTIEAVRARLGDALLISVRTFIDEGAKDTVERLRLNRLVLDHRERADRLAVMARRVYGIIMGTETTMTDTDRLSDVAREMSLHTADWKA